MNLDFPQGDVYNSMSDEVRYEFYKKMKDAVWAIKVKINKETYNSTGFCIDAGGLLLTAAHIIEVEGEEGKGKGKAKQEPPTLKVSARRDKDDKFWRCEVAHELKHFDLLLLKVDGGDLRGGFNYVSIDGRISRNIPYGREVFTIGICQTEEFHLLRGRLTYSNEHDETDYEALAKEKKFDVTRKTENLNFYKDRTYRVREGSLASDDDLHPKLIYLQMQFIGITKFEGASGAPIFDSKGRVIGILQHHQFSMKGVTSAAMEAMVKSYWKSIA